MDIGRSKLFERETKLDSVEAQIGRLTEKLNILDVHIGKLTDKVAAASAENGLAATDSMEGDLRSLAEARESLTQLGENVCAERLATFLAEIDTWLVKPEGEEELCQFKLELATRLRQKVKDEVVALQKAALHAPDGNKGVAKHSEAGSILALYPMSDDNAIIEEVRQLAAQQAEVAVRLEVIRRQKYNFWATTQVEAAIKKYNDIKSAIPRRTDKQKLIASLVGCLGRVDPALLEPIVLELYNYCIDNTKGALSDAEKIELAKKMTDPTVVRKTLGDF